MKTKFITCLLLLFMSLLSVQIVANPSSGERIQSINNSESCPTTVMQQEIVTDDVGSLNAEVAIEEAVGEASNIQELAMDDNLWTACSTGNYVSCMTNEGMPGEPTKIISYPLLCFNQTDFCQNTVALTSSFYQASNQRNKLRVWII